MTKRNNEMGYRETIRAAHEAASKGARKVVDGIDMSKTASGNPRFTSRSDGAERGIIENGFKRHII